MANEFKVKNGIKFANDTVQTTAGLPLTGGALTGNVTTAGTIAINHVVGSTPGLDVNHSGTQVYALRVGDQTTITNNTGIYLRTTSTATVAWGAGGKLVLATSGGSITRYTIGSAGQLGIGASESFGTAGQVLTSGGPSAAPSWTTVSGGGGSTLTVSDTAPGSPTAGALWWDSSVGSLRIYYNDGTSSQWVDAVNAQGLQGTAGRTILSGAIDPTTEGDNGDFYINTTTKYIFGPKASGTWPAGTYMLGTTQVSIGTAPPTTPLAGSTWWDSSIGKLFVYYDDGSSAQWVGVANDPGVDGVGVAVGGTIGQALVKNSATDYDTTWTSIIPSSGIAISAGKFNTSSTAPTNTIRLNYEGNFYATSLNGTLAATNITATGTKNATTFLRGDNSWAVPVGVVSIKETTYVTGSGTFTADPKALFTNIICTGGGGGGGGVDWTSGYGAAGGGGAGGTSIGWFTPAEMGATAAYAVGAAGTAGAASTGGTGGTGGASTFNPVGTGATLTGNGGVGGTGAGSTANAVATVFSGGTGGTATSGDINREGGNGGPGMAMSATFMASGAGGMSYWGSGAKGVVLTATGSSAGTTATSNGDGGSGACNSNNTSGVAGGAGAIGKIYIIEYLSA